VAHLFREYVNTRGVYRDVVENLCIDGYTIKKFEENMFNQVNKTELTDEEWETKKATFLAHYSSITSVAEKQEWRH